MKDACGFFLFDTSHPVGLEASSPAEEQQQATQASAAPHKVAGVASMVTNPCSISVDHVLLHAPAEDETRGQQQQRDGATEDAPREDAVAAGTTAGINATQDSTIRVLSPKGCEMSIDASIAAPPTKETHASGVPLMVETTQQKDTIMGAADVPPAALSPSARSLASISGFGSFVGGSKLLSIDEAAAKETEKELHQDLDFDVNPSELYLLLQRRDWIGATQRLKQFPEEATHWICRKEVDGKLRWRLLPIHGAIIFSAPDTMIQALVDAYPGSVSSKDDQGMLPLHLSYRMGSPANVVEVLLNAYPESVEIKDRKGRTPVIMAQTSKGPNRAEFLKTIERKCSGSMTATAAAAATAAPSPSNAAEAAPSVVSASAVSTTDGRAKVEAVAGQRAIYESQNKDHKDEVEAMKAEAQKTQIEVEKQHAKLRAELKLSEEASSVLVEHVSTLEKKLKQAEETETALATRIATLDNSFKATLREKQALEVLLTTERDGIKAKNEDLETLLVKARADCKKLSDKLTLSQVMAVKDRKALEEKLKGCTSEYGALKVDYDGVIKSVTILECQLSNKIMHEQKLVKQVSSLARQLTTATEDNDKATHAFSERVHALMRERDDLRSTVKMICKKLFAVALFLGEMEIEQQEIFDKAVSREREMAEAAGEHRKLVADVMSLQQYFEEAKDQRALLVELMRQQETAFMYATDDRKKVVAAVEDHAKLFESNVQVRQELVEDASSLKHQISDILGSVKLYIPKGVVPEASSNRDDEQMVDEVIRTVLSKQNVSEDAMTVESPKSESASSSSEDELIMERLMKAEVRVTPKHEEADEAGAYTFATNADDEESTKPEAEAEPVGPTVELKTTEAQGTSTTIAEQEAEDKPDAIAEIEADTAAAVNETEAAAEEPVEQKKDEQDEIEQLKHLMDEPVEEDVDEPVKIETDVEALLAETESQDAEEEEEEEQGAAEPVVRKVESIEIEIDIKKEEEGPHETLEIIEEEKKDDEQEPPTVTTADDYVVNDWKALESPCEVELEKWKDLLLDD